MVKGKARAAGSFLGGIANNPGIIILGGLAIALLFFQKDIRGFFGGLKFPEFPDIKFPEFPTFEFPEITFPTFEFPDITFPEFPTFEFPDTEGFFAGLQEQFNKLFEPGAITPEPMPGDEPPLSPGFAGGIQERRRAQQQAAALAAIPDRDIRDDVEGLTPAQRFAFIERGVIPTGFEVLAGQLVEIASTAGTLAQPSGPGVPPPPIQSFLLDEPTQQFGSGGLSFIGGSIFETPIENLSLSQIIDKFMVTASQAANIRAIAEGFTPEEELFLQGSGDVFGFTGFNPAAVSDPQFQGKSPEEIALFLTGGNISNF